MITVNNVSKIYGSAAANGLVALDDVSLEINPGELVALIGASGSGKSTLLNVMGGIDAPTNGTVIVDGQNIAEIGERGRTLLRRNQVGIIFQFFNLMPTLTVLENVTLPAELAGKEETESKERARELLEAVGMGKREGHRPHELSGGEMQRTAIARALVNSPKILLADEPTGNLDSSNGKIVLELLNSVARKEGLTMIMATHDPAIAATMERVIEMKDGKIMSDTMQKRESTAAEG